MTHHPWLRLQSVRQMPPEPQICSTSQDRRQHDTPGSVRRQRAVRILSTLPWGFLVVAIGSYAVLAALGVITPREPTYRNKPLSDYLDQIRPPSSSGSTKASPPGEALAALEATLPDSASFLVFMLQARD